MVSTTARSKFGKVTKVQTDTFERLISATDAGKLLGIHPVTILRWAREGRIPHRRLGRKVKFRKTELDSWQTTLYTDSAVRVAQP
jgi:excisionase family DNA binding protein